MKCVPLTLLNCLQVSKRSDVDLLFVTGGRTLTLDARGRKRGEVVIYSGDAARCLQAHGGGHIRAINIVFDVSMLLALKRP